MKEELGELVKEFKDRIKDGKQNPLLIGLDEYDGYIAGNIEDGSLGMARYYAKLLVEFYVDGNPFNRQGEEEKMEAIKEANPGLYRAMDAAKRALAIGKAAEIIPEYDPGLYRAMDAAKRALAIGKAAERIIEYIDRN